MELAWAKTSSSFSREVVARCQIFDGDAHDAVKLRVDVLNLRFEFLPENFLLACGRSGNLAEARSEE